MVRGDGERPDRSLDEHAYPGRRRQAGQISGSHFGATDSTLCQAGQNTETGDIWGLYGWHWWNTLYSLGAEETIVFDTETTGTNPELDEAVSITPTTNATS